MTPTDLREARLRLGLSQAQICRGLGVDPVTWNRWELGKQEIRHPAILRLALERLEMAPSH